MSWNFYRPYVSVAQRRTQAARHAQQLAKKGQALAPVKIEGKAIARTFWGRSWCGHLESFGDYANRLPRGRTYVRNGSVLDVQIAPGKVTALIMGSSLYRGTIRIAPLGSGRWKAIKAECAGKIDSLVGLLQGRLSDAVMRTIADPAQGLFPSTAEIKLECSCPDHAGLCKHLAAVLYGVGARLDTQPELLFVLRGVDHLELIGAAAGGPVLAAAGEGTNDLDAARLADVFGIEIEPVATKTKEAFKAARNAAAAAAPAERKVKATRTTQRKTGKAAVKARTGVKSKRAGKRDGKRPPPP